MTTTLIIVGFIVVVSAIGAYVLPDIPGGPG